MKKEHKQSIKDCIAAAKELTQLELAQVIETLKAYEKTFTKETNEELKQYTTTLLVGYRKLLKK